MKNDSGSNDTNSASTEVQSVPAIDMRTLPISNKHRNALNSEFHGKASKLQKLKERYAAVNSARTTTPAQDKRYLRNYEAKNNPDPAPALKLPLDNKVALANALRVNSTPSEDLLHDALKQLEAEGIHFKKSVYLYGYIADFYCESKKLVIELDGRFHKDRKEKDEKRDSVLAAQGITTLRFWSSRAFWDMPKLINEIRKAGGLLQGTK